MKISYKIYSICALAFLTLAQAPAMAQEHAFTLQEAIEYAVDKNQNVANSQLDALSAEAKIGETRAIGLPQITVNANIIDNIIIQRFFLPGGGFDPSAPPNPDADPVAIEFGVNKQGSVSATLNQLIFNGSYFVGLRAAKTYRELAQKSVTQSKVTVAEAVSKAYYSVLVAEEQSKVLNYNVDRLDSLLKETKLMNAEGFVESIDVDRVEVQLNNLLTERQKTINMIQVSYALLKFQMGMVQSDSIALRDSLNQNIDIDQLKQQVVVDTMNYGDRIEYSLLNTQRKLADLDIRNVKSGYLPALSASLGYGHNNGADNYSRLFSMKWFNNSALTINLNVPIFDGLSKNYQLQQKRLALKKLDNSQTLLKQSIDLERTQAVTNIVNSLGTLSTLQRNLDLAQEVTRVTRIKYEEGVGSNIELINAESALKEAQTNYYASLYDVLIAKVDFLKAKGMLYQD